MAAKFAVCDKKSGKAVRLTAREWIDKATLTLKPAWRRT
jgi:hypothetical protein